MSNYEVLIYGRQIVKPAAKLQELTGVDSQSRDTITCIASGLLKLGFSINWCDLKTNPFGTNKHNSRFFVAPNYYSEIKAIRYMHKCQNIPGILVDAPMIRGEVYKGFRTLFIENYFDNSFENDSRAKELNLIYESKKRKEPEYILIAAPGIPHYPYLSTYEWVKEKVDELKDEDKDILVRLHPLDSTINSDQWLEFDIDTEKDPSESVSKSYVLITSASSIAIEAFLLGIPVVSDKHAPYNDVTYKSYKEINSKSIDYKDIQNVLNSLSYTQWSVEEICQGKPIVEYFQYLIL